MVIIFFRMQHSFHAEILSEVLKHTAGAIMTNCCKPVLINEIEIHISC